MWKLIKLLFETTADGHVVNASLKSLLGLYYVHKLPQLSITMYAADERKTELLFHVVHLSWVLSDMKGYRRL